MIASIAGDLAEAIKEQGSGNPEPHPKAGPMRLKPPSRAEASGGVLVAPAERVRAVH